MVVRRKKVEEGKGRRSKEVLTEVSTPFCSAAFPTEASLASSSSSGERGPTGTCLLPRHT